MQINSDASRRYLRWYFCTASLPHEQQAQGIPVKLYQSGLFGKQLCLAVLKDISLGGAGVLVPLSRTVPEVITVVYDNDTRIDAAVVYRRQVSDKLVFLGLSWRDNKRQQRLKLLRRLSKKALREQRDSDVTVTAITAAKMTE